MGTLANSDYSDEMQHNQQCQHCLLRLKQCSGAEMLSYLDNFTHDHGQSHTYCINMYGKTHQTTMG